MNKVICNLLTYVLRSEIEPASDRTITLKEGVTWKNIPVTSKPVYQSEITQTGLSNPLNKETVSAQMLFNDADPVFYRPNLPCILKLQSDKETFYVGTYDLPARLTFTNNRVTTSLSFKTSSPA